MTIHDELIHIKNGIDADIATTDEQISQMQTTITSLEETLSILSPERLEKQEALDQAESALRDITRSHATHQARCEHARGTSLEEAMQAELAALATEREAAETAVRTLQDEVTSLKDAEARYTQEQHAARARLADLEAHRTELVSNRAHFDEQHAAATQKDALAKIQAADEAIAHLEAELQEARHTRRQAQEEAASALSPWHDLAARTLREIGVFDEHPAVTALAAKKHMVEVIEQGRICEPRLTDHMAAVLAKSIPIQEIRKYGGRAHSAQLRTQNKVTNHILFQLEYDMDELDRVVTDIQQAHQEAHVRALLERAAEGNA